MMKSIGVALIVLVFVLVFNIAGLQPCMAQNPGDAFFSGSSVHQIEIYFSQTGFWDSLTLNYEQSKITGTKIYMRADSLFVDGQKISAPGVRLKGNSAYNAVPGVKKPFKLDFDRYIPGQDVDGLLKLNLHNEDRDPTMMRSKIIADFLGSQNIPGPRIGYSRLFINGIYWGLYTAVEQIDKTFLKSNFEDNDGNLYKALPKYFQWEANGGATLEYLGDNAVTYDSIYELKTNTTEGDWSGFTHLLKVINNTAVSQFYDSLESVFNSDEYLKAWAAMALFVNHDAYPWLGNNYYVYQNPIDGRFHWIAWDFNLGIGTIRSGLSIEQAEALSVFFLKEGQGPRPLALRMLDNAYYRDRYLGWICAFVNSGFDPAVLHPKIDSIANLIRTDLYADVNKPFSNAQFEDNISYTVTGKPGLKPFIANRYAAVVTQLDSLGCPSVGIDLPAPNQMNYFFYPNPMTTTAGLYIENGVLNPNHKLLIYSISGQYIKTLEPSGADQFTIHRNDMSKGMYFFRLFEAGKPLFAGKFLVW